MSRLDDKRPPRWPVLKVVRVGEPWVNIQQGLADLFGVEHTRIRDQLLN